MKIVYPSDCFHVRIVILIENDMKMGHMLGQQLGMNEKRKSSK